MLHCIVVGICTKWRWVLRTSVRYGSNVVQLVYLECFSTRTERLPKAGFSACSLACTAHFTSPVKVNSYWNRNRTSFLLQYLIIKVLAFFSRVFEFVVNFLRKCFTALHDIFYFFRNTLVKTLRRKHKSAVRLFEKYLEKIWKTRNSKLNALEGTRWINCSVDFTFISGVRGLSMRATSHSGNISQMYLGLSVVHLLLLCWKRSFILIGMALFLEFTPAFIYFYSDQFYSVFNNVS